MECVCLGDVYEEEVEYLVECANLRDPLSVSQDRNYELFRSLNLGNFYEFLSSLAKTLNFNYFSTSRPTRLEHDSSAREMFKTIKNMFSQKRRKLTFNLGQPGNMSGSEPVSTTNPQNCVSSQSKFDFFVDDRNVTVVSVYEGSNLRVTTIPTDSKYSLDRLKNGNDLEFESFKKMRFKSFVAVTGKTSSVTTLCVNDSYGFWFELFVGFSDKSVAFFRLNTNVGLMKGTDEEGFSCANVTDYLYLDQVPTFSKFSSNRELVLVATRSCLYLVEKSGFNLEYEKLCEFKPGSLVCADFLNDFEVMVLENDYVLTVYKKYDLKFNKFIRYNLHSLLSVTSAGTSSGVGTNYNPKNPKKVLNNDMERRFGKFVKDHNGNVYLMVRNMNLVKLTWNESLIPYSNNVVFQTPTNMNDVHGDLRTKGIQRLVYNFNVENNMVAVTFKGSHYVHLYSLSSFKELYQLKPPKPDYFPKFLTSNSKNNFCYLVVLWSHKSNFNQRLDENFEELFEKNLHNLDVLRTYKIKSGLTKTVGEKEPQFSYYQNHYKTGYDVDYNGDYKDYRNDRYQQIPTLSSLHPKVNNSLQTRFNNFNKFDDSFHSRNHVFGRSYSDHSPRHPRETIYSIDEFLKNRRR